MYNRSIVQACRYDEISFYKKETDNYENCSQISSLFRRCHDRNSFEADSSGDLVRGIIYTGVQDQRALYSGGKGRGKEKKKEGRKKRKRDKIKGTGIVAYTDENRGQCPKSATIPGFVCHHLPPQTCFRVTESIPVGKRGGFAFCVPPNMVRIRINIYERRTGGPRGVARSNF